ncbi:RNA-binding protein 34-like protein [Chytriomyces cf. hyalinus JEL632]|nr:RNA-binding protein 34-like protein [Chytriomyces cf. hyalinus JEL632]
MFFATTPSDSALDSIFSASKAAPVPVPSAVVKSSKKKAAKEKKPAAVAAAAAVESPAADSNDDNDGDDDAIKVDHEVEGESENEDDSDDSDSEAKDKEDTLKKINLKKEAAEKERLKNIRSIFIGNLPVKAAEKATTKKLMALFKPFGSIESLRFRSIAFSNNLPRKVSYLAKEFHPDRDSMNAYLVYKDEESVDKALGMNGQVFEGKHLRVDKAIKSDTTDSKKSVFLGNLSFDIADEALWEFFKDCGEVQTVRVVRDKRTNIGKGFGYVQFTERHAVQIALKMDGQELAGRKLRVTKCAKSPQTLQRLLRKKNGATAADAKKDGKKGGARGAVSGAKKSKTAPAFKKPRSTK